MTVIDAVEIAARHFQVNFIPDGRGEFRSDGGCPWCGDGGKGRHSRRFKLFVNGRSGPRVWCRSCGKKAFIDSLDKQKPLTAEERLVLKKAAEERRARELADQIDALERIKSMDVHLRYHEALTPSAYEYWITQGISPSSMNHYKLGFCDKCPTAPYSSSHTIPVVWRDELWNVRHVLTNPNGQGKYRPQMGGLPITLFNADMLDIGGEECMLVEGEKKAMVVQERTGIPTIGTMGKQVFLPHWTKYFDDYKTVYVAFDPDAYEEGLRVASLLNGKSRLASIPVKPDDFFVLHGGTVDGFRKFLDLARPV